MQGIHSTSSQDGAFHYERERNESDALEALALEIQAVLCCHEIQFLYSLRLCAAIFLFHKAENHQSAQGVPGTLHFQVALEE